MFKLVWFGRFGLEGFVCFGRFRLVYLLYQVWIGRFGLVRLVWYIWLGRFSVVLQDLYGRFGKTVIQKVFFIKNN